MTRSYDNDNANTLSMVVLAAAVGALAGVLFAPKRGSEMREDINRRVNDLTNRAQDKASQGADAMSTKAQDVADKVRSSVSRTADKAQDAANDTAESTKDFADRAAEATKAAADETAAETKRRTTK